MPLVRRRLERPLCFRPKDLTWTVSSSPKHLREFDIFCQSLFLLPLQFYVLQLAIPKSFKQKTFSHRTKCVSHSQHPSGLKHPTSRNQLTFLSCKERKLPSNWSSTPNQASQTAAPLPIHQSPIKPQAQNSQPALHILLLLLLRTSPQS